jgi:hypothetical protein
MRRPARTSSRVRSEGNLASGRPVAATHAALDLSPGLLDRDVEAIEHDRSQPGSLAKQTHEQVLRPDGRATEVQRLVLRESDRLARPLREAREHPAPETT